MPSTLRIKRRASGGAAGAPAALKTSEIAYNETDDILYIGFGDDGGGNATSIRSFAGAGAFTALTGNQTIAGIKTFSSSPIVPTPSTNDNTTKAASTAFVVAEIPSYVTSQKGANNGLASLDGSGKVLSAQLPSYVDDVLEFANLAGFPGTGETGKLYIAIDTGKEYRWSGSIYVELVSSPGTTDNVPEGSTNLYFTVARVLAAVLTGISFATNSAITAADTILQALGKLQAQINGYAASTQTFTNKTMSGASNTFSAIPNTAITGLGTMSTQNANAVNITGGTIDGVTIDGGTF